MLCDLYHNWTLNFDSRRRLQKWRQFTNHGYLSPRTKICPSFNSMRIVTILLDNLLLTTSGPDGLDNFLSCYILIYLVISYYFLLYRVISCYTLLGIFLGTLIMLQYSKNDVTILKRWRHKYSRNWEDDSMLEARAARILAGEELSSSSEDSAPERKYHSDTDSDMVSIILILTVIW